MNTCSDFAASKYSLHSWKSITTCPRTQWTKKIICFRLEILKFNIFLTIYVSSVEILTNLLKNLYFIHVALLSNIRKVINQQYFILPLKIRSWRLYISITIMIDEPKIETQFYISSYLICGKSGNVFVLNGRSGRRILFTYQFPFL